MTLSLPSAQEAVRLGLPVIVRPVKVAVADEPVILPTLPIRRWREELERFTKLAGEDGDNLPLRVILNAVSNVTGIRKGEIISHRRHVPVVRARHIYCYLAKKLTSKSFPQIGQHIGGRDHSTIIHAVGKVSDNLAEYEADMAKVMALLSDEKGAP